MGSEVRVLPGTFIFHKEMRKIDNIIIHHSGNTDTPEKIRELHVEKNGWDDIGYHFMISREGQVFTGRKLETIGAHVKRFNESSIGICLLGNFDNEEPQESQLLALNNLINNLMEEIGLEDSCIKLHRDFEDVEKSCPGKNISKELILSQTRLK